MQQLRTVYSSKKENSRPHLVNNIRWFLITRSAVALSTVLRAGWLSYGKCDFRPPYSSAPNEPIKMAFGTRDYVVETTPLANYYPTTPFRLPHGKG